jgi:putative flippase GtrA
LNKRSIPFIQKAIFLIEKIIDRQFIKFLLTGILNTLFGFLIYSLFTYLVSNSTLAVILSNTVGVLFNFRTYSQFVFKSKDNSRIFRFCIVYALIMSVQILLLKLMASLGIEDPYLGGFLLLPLLATMSFLLMKKVVFREAMIQTKNPDHPSHINE